MHDAKTLPKELPTFQVTTGPTEHQSFTKHGGKGKDPRFSIEPAHRRAVNDRLKTSRPGHVCAVLLPGSRDGHQRLIVVPVPRGTTGKAPRRGVHIPELPIMSMRLQNVSKHARQQAPRAARKDLQPTEAGA